MALWESKFGFRPQKPKDNSVGAEIVKVFRQFDLNGDGSISRQELQHVLQGIDQNFWSQDKIDAVLTSAGEGGVISYEGFVAWLTSSVSDWSQARQAIKDVPSGGLLFAKLLGSELHTKGGVQDASAALQGKYVGLYFSADWCAPCRDFTPKLRSAYTNELKDKPLELVFVSSDRDQACFDKHFGEMPWAAIPYNSDDVKMRLARMFSVTSLPALVVLAEDGSCACRDGVHKVLTDLQSFPWTPQPEDRSKCDRIFEEFDRDKDGYLSISEYGQLAVLMCTHFHEMMWPMICQELDMDPAMGLTKDALFLMYTEMGIGCLERDFQAVCDQVRLRRLQLASTAMQCSRLDADSLAGIFAKYDPEKDLTKGEFKTLWDELGFQEEFLEQFFVALDINANGVISFQELLAGLTICSATDLDATAELVLQVYDTNKTGCLEREEWKVAITSCVRILRASVALALKPMLVVMGGRQTIFRELPADDTDDLEGMLSSDAIVEEILSDFPMPTADDLDGSFDQVDTNTDGKLTLDELKLAFHKDPQIARLCMPNSMPNAGAKEAWLRKWVLQWVH